MSIILDALRKSEAARRRNEAPELFASMPNPTEPAHKPGGWPGWTLGAAGAVGIVGVACLALALWLILAKDAAREDAAPVRTAENASAKASTKPAAAADTPASDPSPQSSFATAPTMTNTAPDLPIPATQVGAARDAAIASNGAVAAPTQIPAANAATAVPASGVANAAPAAAPRVPPVPMPAPRISAPTMPAAADPAPASVAPTAFRSPQSDAPMAVADLDAGARQQLPPLKLSMHVWNEAPTQRFVILDGQRLREGDVLGEVVIERITRDGAQLSWRGTALKLEWR